MKYKDYYKILGLKNEKVSEEEIKIAYRKLAKKYHPDINGGNESITEKFKEVNEAYHILGDENTRKKYDRVYFAYRFKDGFSLNNAKNKVDTENGFSEMMNMVFGKKEESKTKGNLSKNEYPIVGDNVDTEINISLEEAFFGAEKRIGLKTVDNNIKTVVIKIPSGIHSGEKIRLSGLGKEGKNGGPNGDLYIKINILEHKKFKLEGKDLILDLPLTPWEAALGCEIDVQSIDSNLLVTVPKNISTGERIKFVNNGYFDEFGKRGDLFLEVKIVIPKSFTNEEIELFTKLKEVSKFSPRK